MFTWFFDRFLMLFRRTTGRLALGWGVLLLLSGFQTDFPPPLENPYIAYTDADATAIILHDVVTGVQRRLHLGPGQHHVWDTSPDGCRLLFTRTDGTRPAGLYSARIDGTDARSLLDLSELTPADWDAWEPDWSPDGQRIALTLARTVDGLRESRVAWVPGDGGAPTFYSVAGDEHAPVWSPDGAWLAYVAYEQRPAGAALTATAEPSQAENAPLLREADLWIVSADGLTKERVTRFDVGSAAAPFWNPSGTLIGFSYAPTPNEHQFWMIAATPDAIPTQLSFAWTQVLSAVWHPDGESMVAAVRGMQDTAGARLWQVPLVGNADADAVPFPLPAELADSAIDYPRFNPDGERLALRAAYAPVIVDLTTNTVQTLPGTGNTPLVWSAPGFSGQAACDA